MRSRERFPTLKCPRCRKRWMRYSADFADCPRCGPADEEVKPIEVGQRRPKLSQPKPRKVRSFFMPWEGPDEDED